MRGEQRAFIDLDLDGVKVKALVDTGASRSLLRQDRLKKVTGSTGRSMIMRPVGNLVSVTEQPLKVLGCTEVRVQGVGPVTVTIVPSMRHEMILGWDQLCRHGVVIESAQPVLQ